MKIIKKRSFNYNRRFDENPIVINQLIKDYIGFDETRYCNKCKNISHLHNWFIKNNKLVCRCNRKSVAYEIYF